MLRPLLAASTLAVALALAGVATTGARAQTEATPAAQAQFTDSHLAIAREVVASSGMTRSFEAVIPQMQEGLLRQYGRNPTLLEDASAVIRDLGPEMELQRRAMLNRAARVIASRLAEEELTAVAAFFESEAGRRYVEVQPAILDGLISEMQVWSQELNQYLQIRVQAEMVARREAQAAGGGAAPAPQ
ncbi:DUF2059 domain-containing protein [Salinarimonas chemoclinalis]|uniref:DUF2059 domain-containing protein n=1 Tax=Salinarimonas chemoclinalis TaxID=3241599 RepID=UPI003555C302